MGRILSMFVGAPAWLLWAAGGLLVALLAAGWLLWGQIERNGRLGEQLRSANAEIERTRMLMAKQAEVYESNDRAVTAITEYRDVVYVTRTVAFVRDIYRHADARDPAGDTLRATWRRMRELAPEDRSDRSGTAGGALRPAGASGPARPRNPDQGRGR